MPYSKSMEEDDFGRDGYAITPAQRSAGPAVPAGPVGLDSPAADQSASQPAGTPLPVPAPPPEEYFTIVQRCDLRNRVLVERVPIDDATNANMPRFTGNIILPYPGGGMELNFSIPTTGALPNTPEWKEAFQIYDKTAQEAVEGLKAKAEAQKAEAKAAYDKQVADAQKKIIVAGPGTWPGGMPPRFVPPRRFPRGHK